MVLRSFEPFAVLRQEIGIVTRVGQGAGESVELGQVLPDFTQSIVEDGGDR